YLIALDLPQFRNIKGRFRESRDRREMWVCPFSSVLAAKPSMGTKWNKSKLDISKLPHYALGGPSCPTHS
ncbi:mCG144753, partial [Mus musculus]